MVRWRQFGLCACVLAGWAGGSIAVHAAPIMYDGFSTSESDGNGATSPYTVGGIRTQTATDSNIGFTTSTSWNRDGTNTNSLWEVVSGALTHPSAKAGVGGRVDFIFNNTATGSTGRSVNRAFTAGDQAAGSVYYFSGMMSYSSLVTAASNTLIATQISEDTSVNLTSKGGVKWGFRGTGTEIRAFFGHPDTASTVANVDLSGALSPNVTHLFVAKVETNVSGNEDRLTVWFDPTNTDTEATATGKVLDGISSYAMRNNQSANLDTLVLNFAADIGNGVNASYDEIRFGTTWDDVVAVPEPTGAACLFLAAGLLARRRRAC